jgi:MFS family permease
MGRDVQGTRAVGHLPGYLDPIPTADHRNQLYLLLVSDIPGYHHPYVMLTSIRSTPTLFKRGGLDPEAANLATAGVGVVLFITAWIPVLYFDRFGRKTWLQIGTVGMFAALIGIATLLRHAESHPGDPSNNAIIAFPYLFYLFFNMSWSSGSWTYAAEIFPISLRVGLSIMPVLITVKR